MQYQPLKRCFLLRIIYLSCKLGIMTFMGLALSPLNLPTLHACHICPCHNKLVFQEVSCKVKGTFIFPIVFHPLNNYVCCPILSFLTFTILHVVNLNICFSFLINIIANNLSLSFGNFGGISFHFFSCILFMVVYLGNHFPFILGWFYIHHLCTFHYKFLYVLHICLHALPFCLPY